jgi:hypothetical protein
MLSIEGSVPEGRGAEEAGEEEGQPRELITTTDPLNDQEWYA